MLACKVTSCPNLLESTSRSDTDSADLNQPSPTIRVASQSTDANEKSQIFLHVCKMLTQENQEPRCPHANPLGSCQQLATTAHEDQLRQGLCKRQYPHDGCPDCVRALAHTENRTPSSTIADKRRTPVAALQTVQAERRCPR